MVAMILGQSNAGNSGQGTYVSSRDVLNYYGKALYRCEDPMLGATGGSGSIWCRLGDRLVSEGLYEKVIFVPLAIGGSSSEAWAPGGDCHGRIEKAVAELRGINLAVTHVLWIQGEADCASGATPERYRRNVESMTESLRGMGIWAPVFIAVATYQRHMTCPAIQRAQSELANSKTGIHEGPNLDSLIGAVYRYDGTHLTAEGLEAAAAMWVRVFRSHAGNES
jgi:lysophospholipase L1-like esterase